jgi:hypothetical protein
MDFSLQVDIQFDETAYQNYLWALYAIDGAKTLYETPSQQLGNDEVVLSSFAVGSNISSTESRQREQADDDGDNNEDDGDNPQEDVDLQPNVVQMQWNNVDPGVYYFQIENALGNGLVHYNNHVRITQGRRILVNVPHNFGDFYRVYFNLTDTWLVNDILRQQELQELETLVDRVELMVDIFYDQHPSQTSWELRNVASDEVLAFISAGSIAESQYSSYVHLVPRGQQYRLTVWDTAGDGLTAGNGWINVWVGHVMVYNFEPFAYEATTLIDV